MRFWTESYWDLLAPGDGLYRPLGLTWIAFLHFLFGAHHAAYLAVGLALHVGFVVTLRMLLRGLFAPGIAFAAAAIAAVHPISAEAVVTVYGQLDVLAALLVVAALCMARRADGGRVLVAGTCGVAALLVKESALVAPLLAWLVDARRAGGRTWPTRGTCAIAAGVAIGIALRFLALGEAAMPGAVAVTGADSLGARAQLVAVSVGTALRLLVAPWGQTIDYGHLRASVAHGASAEWAWVIGCFALAGWARQRAARADVRFGIAWLAIALLPVASLLPIGFLAAERALYLPRAGFAIVVAALAKLAIDRVVAAPVWRARIAAAALAGITLLGVAASWRVARQWRTPLSLWSHTVEAHPLSPKAHAALAIALLDEAGVDAREATPLAAARRAAERCLELNPDSGAGRYALGLVAEREGRPAEAARLFAEAARIEPSLRRPLQWRP